MTLKILVYDIRDTVRTTLKFSANHFDLSLEFCYKIDNYIIQPTILQYSSMLVIKKFA